MGVVFGIVIVKQVVMIAREVEVSTLNMINATLRFTTPNLLIIRLPRTDAVSMLVSA